MGKIRCEIIGLNLDRFLDALQKEALNLENIERSDYNRLVFLCESKNFAKIKGVMVAHKLDYKIVGGSGILYFLRRNWYRFGLIVGLLFTFYACFFATGIYWRVEVEVDTNNAKIKEQVVQFLNSENLKSGAKKQKIATRDIERQILKNVNDCSLVVVEEEGVNLKVFVKQAVGKKALSEKSVVASHSGVIEKIDFASGNLLVNVGEAVVAGQPLISAGKVGDCFMEAKGDIFARCWIMGECVGSTINKSTSKTGRVITVEYIEIFGKRAYISKNTEDDAKSLFALYETEQTESNLSQNNLLPIKKISINYYEIEEVCDIIDSEQLVENLKHQALENASKNMPVGAENLGVNYKVINLGSVTKVICNIETVLKISIRGE